MSTGAAWLGTLLALLFWLRFLFHADAGFPGSLEGSVLGIVGASLLLVPLAYSVGKRVLRVRGRALRAFLDIHIFAALVGANLAVVHTGHKFDNPLGVLLTAVMLVVVVSGFVGRYLLRHCSRALADKRQALLQMSVALPAARTGLEAALNAFRPARPRLTLWLALVAPVFVRDAGLRAAVRHARRVAEAAASLETSVTVHDELNRWLRRWLSLHIVLTTIFYVLLSAHVAAVTYYGLRWWPR